MTVANPIPFAPDQITQGLIGSVQAYRRNGWYAVLPHEGRMLKTAWKEGTPQLSPEYRIFSEEMCRALNKLIHHDGRWIVAWTDFSSKVLFDRQNRSLPGIRVVGARKLWALWCDNAGDIHLAIDCEDNLPTLLHNVNDFIEGCEQAFAKLRETQRHLDIKPEETYMAALGERSKDPGVFPSLMPFD